MVESDILLIAVAVLVMAALYSTVGHGGGSGYLAVLALAAIAPEQMRPTALVTKHRCFFHCNLEICSR